MDQEAASGQNPGKTRWSETSSMGLIIKGTRLVQTRWYHSEQNRGLLVIRQVIGVYHNNSEQRNYPMIALMDLAQQFLFASHVQ